MKWKYIVAMALAGAFLGGWLVTGSDPTGEGISPGPSRGAVSSLSDGRAGPLAKVHQREVTEVEAFLEELPGEAGFFKWMEASAMTHEALQSGDWSDPAVWGGVLPGPGARVFIPEGVSVTLGDFDTEHLKALRIDGELVLAPTESAVLNVDSLFVNADGSLRAGEAGSPLSGAAEILINLQAWVTAGTTGEDLAHSTQLISFGEVALFGQEKTAMAMLERAPGVGDREIYFEAAPLNWEPGDVIVLGGNRQTREEVEMLMVESIEGNRVKVMPADGPMGAWSGLRSDYATDRDARGFAVNLSRNIAISSTPPESEAVRELPQGAMIFEESAASQTTLSHVSSLGLGMEEAILPGYDATVDRPALAFFGDGGGSSATVTGLALVDGPEIPIHIQATTVSISDSVANDANGGAWLTEFGAPSRLVWSANRSVPVFVGQ